MIVLDENIPEDQRYLLRGWRLRVDQIGDDVGRKGMKDDQVLVLLRTLPTPTFFTRDFDFWGPGLAHSAYGLVVLDVGVNEVATFVRRLLRQPEFNTKTKRLGRVMLVSHTGIAYQTAHESRMWVPWL